MVWMNNWKDKAEEGLVSFERRIDIFRNAFFLNSRSLEQIFFHKAKNCMILCSHLFFLCLPPPYHSSSAEKQSQHFVYFTDRFQPTARNHSI